MDIEVAGFILFLRSVAGILGAADDWALARAPPARRCSCQITFESVLRRVDTALKERRATTVFSTFARRVCCAEQAFNSGLHNFRKMRTVPAHVRRTAHLDRFPDS